MKLITVLGLMATIALVTSAHADTARIIEEARGKARQIEEAKAALSDPDQNVRLAVFSGLVVSDDAAMRELALDMGLSSADSLLRGAALKHSFLARESVIMTLSPSQTASAAARKAAEEFIAKRGSIYSLKISSRDKDVNRGTFSDIGCGSCTGIVSGTTVSIGYGQFAAQLRLQDDNSLRGTARLSEQNQTAEFDVHAELR
jgi:hypothetical protein